jgi:hypothetical protein
MKANEFLAEKWSTKYKRSIDCSNPKGFSQKAHCAGRKKNESINEATKVGREWQHLEDLVFVDGSQGALHAANILKNLGSGSTELNIKWDGRIALYWGREPDGTFVLVGKNGWGKEKYTTPADMQNAITTAGKGEDWRQKLGADMAQVFDIMEKNTSPQFRGYAMGDLLWYPGEPFQITQQGITFTPNKVTYTVNPTSELGKRIAQSSVGIAAHLYYKEFGSSEGMALTDVAGLNGKSAVVLNSRITSYQTKIDTSAVDDIIKDAKTNAQAIDSLLEPQAGLSDMKGIIYTYVNQMSRAGRLNDLATGFFDWLKTSKVSPQKQAKILAMPESKSIPVLFNLVLKVQRVKDDIIGQLDQQTSDITATTDGQAGGEGYAANAEKVKLVPRQRWVPS